MDEASKPVESVMLGLERAMDATAAAQMARRYASRLGLDADAQGAVAVAAAELSANAVQHAGGGTLTLRVAQTPRPVLEIIVEDSGRGIPDLAAAMQDGASTRGADPEGFKTGLGAGLGAVARLMDQLEVCPRREGGLRVIARKWLEGLEPLPG